MSESSGRIKIQVKHCNNFQVGESEAVKHLNGGSFLLFTLNTSYFGLL